MRGSLRLVSIQSICLLFILVSLAPTPAKAQSWSAIEQTLASKYPELPKPALIKAFGFLVANENVVHNTSYMTIIDFDLPSTVERMYVINLQSLALKKYLVAHGRNSGEKYAIRFSNELNSWMTSLGVYLTGAPYIGEHGLSMILHGMEPTNSNAEARGIVLHGAPYVSEETIHVLGYLGRSLGCPAVNPQYSTELVQELSNGSVFLAYHM